MKKCITIIIIVILLTSCKRYKIKYNDGTYIGEGNGHHGVIKVEVTVENNKITNLDVIEDYEIPGLREIVYKELSKVIIKKNTWVVDEISGATLTSEGVKEAVQNALADQLIIPEK